MKKILALPAIVLASVITNQAMAQKDTALKHVGHEIKEGAVKVGQKSKEIASKGRSRISDKVYKDKVSPTGETVYIDGHSRYYWIDDAGHRHYLKRSELVDKH
jgi:hypothetical protein